MKNNRVFGVAMIPDKIIYRKPNALVNEPHNVYFTAETIAKARTNFHKNNCEGNVNIEHSGVQVDGVKLTQSFLIDEKNKTNLPEEFQDLPIGTWMVEYEIENGEVWQLVMDKKLNGFSIEGIFTYTK